MESKPQSKHRTSRIATSPEREDLAWDDGGTSEEQTSSSMSGISFHASIIRFMDSRTILTCIVPRKCQKNVKKPQIYEDTAVKIPT